MGFSNAEAAPICDESDDSLYEPKQCFDHPVGKVLVLVLNQHFWLPSNFIIIACAHIVLVLSTK